MAFDGNRTDYLYNILAEQLKKAIKEMPDHAKLPTRPEIMRSYGVTRATAEKAVSKLTGEGIVYSKVGSGTYVMPRTLENAKGKGASQKVWAIVLPSVLSDVYPYIIRGVEDIAQQNSIAVRICNTDNNAQKQALYLTQLLEDKVDGMIIIPAIPFHGTAESFQPWIEAGIPFVFCNREVPLVEAPRIVTNSFYGSLLATRHLLQNGYRRVAYLSSKRYRTSDERFMGYAAALSEAGVELNDRHVVLSEEAADADAKWGVWGARKLLSLSEPPDAFCCFNDRIALNVYQEILRHGYRIGDDIGVTGFDDIEACSLMNPQLTSVMFPKYETGRCAAELLYAYSQGEAFDRSYYRVLQPTLKIRQSSLHGHWMENAKVL